MTYYCKFGFHNLIIYIFPKQILSGNLCHPIAVLIDNTYFSLKFLQIKFLQIILAYCNKDRIGVLSFSVIVFLFVLPHAVHTYLQWTENIFKGPFTFHKNSTYILYFLCIFIIYLAHQFQNYASILFTNIC